MDTSDETLLIERLRRHGQAAKAIARAVLRDEHLAEDVLQDAYAKAMVHPPRHDSNVSAWFLAIVKNLAIGRSRAEARRQIRDRAGAVGERGAAERSLQALTDAVLALDEPYRGAVLARFYEGLPPRAIAQRDGVPVATVKSRIQRGVSRVRERLTTEDEGENGELLRGVCVLAARSAKGVAYAAGGAALTLKTKAIAAVALLMAAGVVTFREVRAPSEEPTSVKRVADATGAPRAPERPEVGSGDAATVQVEPARQATRREDDPRENHGHVVDASDRPLEGVMVLEVDANRWSNALDRGSFLRYRSSDEELLRDGPPGGRLVLTEADGSFAFEGPRLTGSSSLIVWSVQYGCEFAPIRPWEDNRIIMRPAASVSGFVFDQDTLNPIAMASVMVRAPGVAMPLEVLYADELGRFQTSAHLAGRYALSASLKGYQSTSEDWGVTDAGDAVRRLDLGLRRQPAISIRLLTTSGDLATTEVFGQFGIDVDRAGLRWTLCSRGYSTRAALDLSGYSEWPMAYDGTSGAIGGLCEATGKVFVAAWLGEAMVAEGEVELPADDLSCVLSIVEPKAFQLTIRCDFAPRPKVEAWNHVVVGARSGPIGTDFRTSLEDQSLSTVLPLSLQVRPQGNWLLGVRRDGYRQRWFEVPADGTQQTLDCVLHAITEDATVRVVDPDGNGVARAFVVVRDMGDVIGPQYANWTDAEGNFVLSDLCSLPVDIFVKGPGYAPSILFAVPDGERDGLLVQLAPGRVVNIPHATDPEGPWGVRCEDDEGTTVFDDAWFGTTRHGPSSKFREAPRQATTIVVYERISGEILNRYPIDG